MPSGGKPSPGPAPVYVGMDPGASGGIAYIKNGVAEAGKQAVTDADTWLVVSSIVKANTVYGAETLFRHNVFAVIEKVGGYIKGGEDGSGGAQPGSAAFKFGASYGKLLMALTAAGIPFEEVTPQKWQKGLGVPPRKKDETKTQFKNRLKAKAQQLFPGVKVTLAVADALLLAEFCRRSRTGTL